MARKKQTMTLDTGPQDPLAIMAAAAPGDKETEDKPEVTTDELLKRIAGLEQGLEQAQKTNLALMSAPPQVAQPNYNQPAGNAPALPDPLTDSEAYAEALARRIAAQEDAKREAYERERQAAAAKETQVSALWDTFGERYEDLAEHEELVEVAARRVLSDMAARGVDTNKYMTAASDQFLSDVANRMRADYGKLFEPGAPAPANRTGGIPGGGDAGVRPKGSDGKRVTTMVEDIQAIQKRDGYY